MKLKQDSKTHNEKMHELELKYKLAEQKLKERKLKYEIIKMSLPFHFDLKFNKIIVLLSIAAIILYTIAAILLQKYTLIELSPTLTTCVYAFFGTELLGLAGIKICDTKFISQENNADCNDTASSQYGSHAAG